MNKRDRKILEDQIVAKQEQLKNIEENIERAKRTQVILQSALSTLLSLKIQLESNEDIRTNG